MCTQLQLDKITKALVKCYREVYGSAILDIVLYGSYARGDYDEDSDIDIAAVVYGDRVELQKKLKRVWDVSAEVSLENDVIISPIVIPYDEFARYKHTLPYYRNIEKEGCKIG